MLHTKEAVSSMPRPSTRPVVLFVAHDIERSGAPRVLVDIAARVAATGRAVRVCFPARGGMEEDARRAGLETVVVENPSGTMTERGRRGRPGMAMARLRAFAGWLRECRRGDVGVVWIGSFVGAWAGLAARLAGRPVVFHIHEDVRGAEYRGVPFVNQLRIAVVRCCANAMVFVSRPTVAPFLPKRRGQRMLLISNRVDAGPIDAAPRDGTLRRELGAAEGDVVFLAVAFVSPRKGIDVLLQAFERVRRAVPSARLWIAGADAPGFDEWRRGLDAFVAERGLEDGVRFLGYREDVARLLKSADAFVLASRSEAQPLSIAEAMVAGRPVVATDVGSVRSMVSEGETAFVVPPEDAAALAAAMERLGGDPALRAAFGAAGRQRGLRLFGGPRQTERVAALIDTLGR